MKTISLFMLTLASVLLITASADASVTITRNTTWRPDWTTLAFPAPPATDTAQQLTHYVRLPESVQPGDAAVIAGREEFSNPTWATQSNLLGAYTISGSQSEHWSTPIMGACGMVKLDGPFNPDPAAWSWVERQTAENFDGIAHHWVWADTGMFVVTSTEEWVGVKCYFSRAVGYRDALHDYVIAERSYGKIEALTIR